MIVENHYLCSGNNTSSNTQICKVKSFFIFILSLFIVSLNSCQEVTSTAAGLLSSGDTSTVVFPAPLGSISDYEKILNDEQIRSLDSIIMQFEDKSTYKINIVTVKSIKPYHNLAEYSTDLLNNWENGESRKNSVIIALSEKLDEVHITTGSNLKNTISEKECRRIVKKTMHPEFEKEDFYSGLKKGLKKIIAEIN